MDARTRMAELARRFQAWDLTPLSAYDDLVSSKDDAGRFFAPYVPLVGSQYDKYKVLIYGTAQNIGRCTDLRKDLSANSDKLVWRLYYSMKFDKDGFQVPLPYNEVPIEPFREGIVPALAGLFILVRFGETISNLQDVQEHVAVSNFCKFSLSHGARDMNPNSLAQGEAYWDMNAELVREEVALLNPEHVIIAFNYERNPLAWRAIKKVWPTKELIMVNDPAWIKRGARGCLKPGGSWHKRVASEKTPEIIEAYLPQISRPDSTYVDGFRDLAKTYLMFYLLDWQTKYQGA